MKQKFLAFGILSLLIVACNLPSLLTPTPPIATPLTPATQTPAAGTIQLNNVSLVLPPGLANNAKTEMVAAVSDPNASPWWEIAPAHLEFTLTGYSLQGKFHEPMIFVFPTDEYAQLNNIAGEQIDRLKMILGGSAVLKETLPSVPFFNAGPLIASRIQTLSFQGGSGLRWLTQYDQYPAPVNNHELFYQFQGLTTDGKYYLIAILPITAPVLPEDEKPESSLPAGGVPIPTDIGPNQVYYISVTENLNALAPDSFTPSLNQLDALIQSITVTS